MSNGYIALDHEDINYILSESNTIEIIEAEFYDSILLKNEYKEVLNKYNIKNAKKVIAYFKGDSAMIDVKAIVSFLDSLNGLIDKPNIIYGAGIDNEEKKVTRVILICSI